MDGRGNKSLFFNVIVDFRGLWWTSVDGSLEARAGIEPAFKDLQSSASPFCHRALIVVE